MKRIVLLLLSFAFGLSAMAQERTISGRITSEEGETLPGVNVVVKGTATGTVTDASGEYTLAIPSDANTLVFSFIGLQTQEVAIGQRSVIDVTLSADVTQLSELVVTALGLEKQSRELGYSISGVDQEDLVVARETNVLNALQGKVTGVNITRSGGNLNSSAQVIIRGVTSLSGKNNPLWVVDGVPINDFTESRDNNNSVITGNRDFGNSANVINPDDVASINVLKGAAASALYGSRAAAGVILVTTKKGKSGAGRGPSISVNSSYRFDNLFRAPDFQNEYGGGLFYKYDSSAQTASWGPRIVGQDVTEAGTGETVPLSAYPDNYKDYYRTGKTLINNIAIGDATDNADYRLSITSLDQTGILPNAELERVTISLNAGRTHSEKLSSRFSVQYFNTNSQGTGVAGANDPNIFGWNSFVRSTDFKNFDPWIDDAGNQLGTVGNTDNNPLWIQHENKNEREDNRILGNFQMSYKPIPELTFTGRAGYDFDQDSRLVTNRVGTRGRNSGTSTVTGITATQMNVDVIATYFKSLSSDLQLKVLGGYNFNRRKTSTEILFSQGFSIPELFLPANALTNVPDRRFSERVLFGAYSEVALSYRDWATLTLTGRNDWSSTLPKDNQSYFYPSASLALVFTEALNIQSNLLSYGKLRLSAAQVGNDTDPYQLLFTYLPQTNASGQYSLNQNFPFSGSLGYRATNTIPNANLVPEQQTSYEVGTEIRFLDGRLGLDASFFHTQNKNQILSIAIPETTGFGFKTLNVGQVDNTGIEITLDATVLSTNNFQWNTVLNFSHNESIVKSLAEGVDEFVLSSEFNSIQVKAVPGKEFQIFGIPFLRDSVTNRPLINPDNGLRQSGESQSYGTVFPDFTAGITNNFTYKGFGLSITVDMKSGGKISSSTVGGLWNGGAVAETARNREGTFIDREGVLDNGDGTVRDNDIPIRSAQDFWRGNQLNSISEMQIFDASFAKLRELGVSYNFPDRMFTNSFIRGLQLGVEGRNLALLWSKVPHIDPEANLYGAARDNGGRQGFASERNSVPSTRSIGFNVRLKF